MPFGKHAIIESRLFLSLYRTLIEWNLLGTIEKKSEACRTGNGERKCRVCGH